MSSAVLPAGARWRSRTTFVLALSASAVGLGNLWRFAYLTGEHGGGAFMLAYVACLFFVAVPLLVAEVAIGRHGRGGPLTAIRRASDRSLRRRGWMLAGLLACVTGLLVLALYAVVAGWALAYARYVYLGVFSAAAAPEVGQQFARFVTDPLPQVYWQALFLVVTFAIVVTGVRRGLGLLVWLAIPTLLAMLGFLVHFGFETGDIEATGEYLFDTRTMDFHAGTWLAALGHALFTLGVGVGTGIAYGSYAPERIPIGRSVMAVAVFDTMIALLAGLAVFPVIFANNMAPAMGPGLLFISVPYAFGNVAQGEPFGALFFALVGLAALGSAVAIVEPVVAALIQQLRIARLTATLLACTAAWGLSLAVVMSFTGEGGDWFGKGNLFVFLDGLTAEVLLPLVSLAVAMFVGWRVRPALLRSQLSREPGVVFELWRTLLRFLVPLALVSLLVRALLA